MLLNGPSQTKEPLGVRAPSLDQEREYPKKQLILAEIHTEPDSVLTLPPYSYQQAG